MIDQPRTAELLSAMAATLTEQVLPACEGGAKHAARIVANLCTVLAREAEAGAEAQAATTDALSALLGTEGSLEELVAGLNDRLAIDDPEFDDKRQRAEQRPPVARAPRSRFSLPPLGILPGDPE